MNWTWLEWVVVLDLGIIYRQDWVIYRQDWVALGSLDALSYWKSHAGTVG